MSLMQTVEQIRQGRHAEALQSPGARRHPGLVLLAMLRCLGVSKDFPATPEAGQVVTKGGARAGNGSGPASP